jgi:hypothetical protein
MISKHETESRHNRLALKRAAAHQSQIHGSGGVAAAEFGCATRTAPLRLIFNSWNFSTDKSALEKRLGTTFPLIAGVGRNQASAS